MIKKISLWIALVSVAHAAETTDLGALSRTVDSLGFMRPIPVTLTGFSGEVDSVLRNDLSFMGFEFVSADKALFQIQKNNAAGVGATITQVQYNKAFTGGSTRQQTHALADDIAKTITQKPGIAQTRIALKTRPVSYGVGEIFIADYDGFNALPVTRDGVICASPAWARNSTLIYMSHKLADKPDIFSHNLASGARKKINLTHGSAFSPSVSPDGRRVAMILSKSGSPDLWVCDIDGNGLKQLTTTKEDESSPCWSPDSQTICFASRDSGKSRLYTMPASGGRMQPLSISGVSNLSEPDWSPDGKFLIFTANMGGFRICVVPMEGPLRGTSITLVDGEDPVWAPNSRAVMFVKNVNNRHVLSLLDVPSKKTKDLGTIKGDASQPSWAR